MVAHYCPPKRARGRWRDGETAALIEAWKPIFKRRRDGQSDVWVPARRLDRVQSSRCLVVDDWRVVAAAVNAFRDGDSVLRGSHRTGEQCKTRINTLLAAPPSSRFSAVLRDALSAAGTGEPTTGQPTVTAVPLQEADPVAIHVFDGSATSADNAGNVVQQVPEPEAEEGRAETDTAAGYVRRRSETMAAGLWDGAGAMDASRIPKRPRSSGSMSGAANLRGGALADGFVRYSVDDLLGCSASARDGSAAPVSSVAEAVTKVTVEMCRSVMTMCQNVMMKSLDVEKDGATAGGSNEP